MQLRLERLDSHLKGKLSSLYVLYGDEPLLQIEAGDAIRAAGRRAGCSDREVFFAEAGFDWNAFAAANQNLSLFGGRKFIDLRIPSGKPGNDGARILGGYASSPQTDDITLITLPKLDRAAANSEWFAALCDHGVAIATAVIELAAFPGWVQTRLRQRGLSAKPEALQRIVDRTEGNLLAALQEIDKLALLFPGRELTSHEVDGAVADVARYEVAQLSESWLSGDPRRVCCVLDGLRAEGASPQFVLWQLTEDVHTLSLIAEAMVQGSPFATAVRSARVWGPRQVAVERASKRIDPRQLAALLKEIIHLDALSKGIGRGDLWDEIRACGLRFAGIDLPLAI